MPESVAGEQKNSHNHWSSFPHTNDKVESNQASAAGCCGACFQQELAISKAGGSPSPHSETRQLSGGGRRSEIEDFGSCDLFPSTLPCLFSAAQMSSSVPKQKRLRNKEKSFSCRISFLANFPEESLFKSFPWVVPYYTFAQRLVFPSFFLSRVAAMVFTFCFHYHSCNYKELALARRFMGHILRMPSESTWLMSPGCKDVQPSLSQLPPFPRKIRDPSLLNLARYRQGTQRSGRETQSEFVRSLPAGHPMSKCLGKARRKVHPYRMASAWGHIPSPSSVPSLSCGEITACSA